MGLEFRAWTDIFWPVLRKSFLSWGEVQHPHKQINGGGGETGGLRQPQLKMESKVVEQGEGGCWVPGPPNPVSSYSEITGKSKC